MSQKQARYFRWLEHAPDAAPEREKSGMTHEQMHDFSVTKDAGLPERVKHLANGRLPVTNTAFQQNERVSGSRPAWMESASKHANNAPKPAMADGKPGHWMEEAFKNSGKPGHSLHASLGIAADKKIPTYRVKKAEGSKDKHLAAMARLAENARK